MKPGGIVGAVLASPYLFFLSSQSVEICAALLKNPDTVKEQKFAPVLKATNGKLAFRLLAQPWERLQKVDWSIYSLCSQR